mmetsp:Transcript_4787/g.11504  ORF Transcript_4787/g.11504 Transcript_4787/m.11504 type:complete len:217 (+) Transcript_4787:132-782(+)
MLIDSARSTCSTERFVTHKSRYSSPKAIKLLASACRSPASWLSASARFNDSDADATSPVCCATRARTQQASTSSRRAAWPFAPCGCSHPSSPCPDTAARYSSSTSTASPASPASASTHPLRFMASAAPWKSFISSRSAWHAASVSAACPSRCVSWYAWPRRRRQLASPRLSPRVWYTLRLVWCCSIVRAVSWKRLTLMIVDARDVTPSTFPGASSS